MSVSSVIEALVNCAVTDSWEVGMCGQFCAAMYGYGFSGYRDAVTQWAETPSSIKHAASTEAPAGALVFWGGGSAGHGHVAIADGTGSVWSIDIGGPGTVSRVSAGTIASRWGLPYLGWSAPYFQGAEWSPQMIYGVDVSAYQPINFPLVTPSDNHPVDFAIIKITEGMSTTAGQGYNTKWVSQRQWARDHGLVVGFYHFARPGDMVSQADHFLSQINLAPGDVLAFDWEDTGVTNAQKDAWISYVQGRAPGHKVILYCNKDFWLNRDRTSFAGDGLWIATGGIPAGSPGIKSPWLVHQYSTSGNLDHDVAQFAGRADMLTWAGGDDMALSADDKAWIKDLFLATSLVDNKAHGLGYYAAHAEQALATVLAQARANGTRISAAELKLDAIKTVLDGLDLSGVSDAVAEKIKTIKFIVTSEQGV